MNNYGGQPSYRNGASSQHRSSNNDAADVLEQTIFDSDHLFQQFKDNLSPLLSEAELRLNEMGLGKYKNLEKIIDKHIHQWFKLNKTLGETALEFRTGWQQIHVQLDSAKREIDERDKIIQTQRKDFENDKDQYETQLKVLESALANSIPRNSTLDKFGLRDDPIDENYELQSAKKDLKLQEQEYLKLKNENQRLNENMKILKSSSNDWQQTLMNIQNELSKKEDEILKLRWLTQDLAEERNGLEAKVQQVSKDSNFVSVTPQRQMDYTVDFSKFIDDDDDVSDDAAENGMLLLEMSDDADINPQVAKKLAEALEAVKKVTKFANDRDNQAKQLESQIDDKEKQELSMQMQVGNMQNANPAGEKVPTKRHPHINPGDSADDIVVGRRKSILDFATSFDQERKRRSQHFDKNNKLAKEDYRRTQRSQRRSSIGNIPVGLLPPVVDDVDPLSKSDIGGHTLQQRMDEDDRLYLKSLAKSLAVVNVSRLKETPANSPLNSPTQNAPSPRSEADGVQDPSFDDVVDDADIHNAASINISAAIGHGDHKRTSQKDPHLLQKQIDDKQQLIMDLKHNLRELSENRRRELLHFQSQLEQMKSRCRDWYEQLMTRVRDMEGAYQDKVNQEITIRQREMEQQLENERNKLEVEFQRELQKTQTVQGANDANPDEIDELTREIARLNEELEKFKGKYFDSEQQKIELADQLDEIKEEKFKMEDKLEELATKVSEDLRDNARNSGHRRKTTAEWNDLVQKLREEKENQEAQYEEEFREFERMANEKVVQLEEYYVQQLQMKEVHVQQLQQQLQQQFALKQQEQANNVNQSVNALQQQQNQQLNEQVTNMKRESEKQQELVNKLTSDNNSLTNELKQLKYHEKVINDQLKTYKAKHEANEQKIGAYNASFIELAEKLKQLNDDTKVLRKDKDKAKKKVDKLEKSKKKLKQEIKDLNEKIENITAVTKELVKLKQDFRGQSEQFEKDRQKYNEKINRLEGEMMEQAQKKFESINAYNVEMNNLRTNIKTLQKRINQQELENDKLRETDSQSVLGSAANWVSPTNWWNTKK